MKKIFATLLLLITVTAAQAQDRPTHIRTIEVVGEGQMNVVPNEAILNVGVESMNMSLEKAKQENDEHLQQVIRTLRDAGVAERDIRTQQINIEPQYDYRQDGRQFLGFIVRRTVEATVRDIKKLDDITSRMITAGITSIYNYEYKTSEETRFKQEARVKAVASAKEKANALANELGLKVVKAYSVIEDDVARPVPMFRLANAAMQDQSTFSLGEIVIGSSVRVIFEVQ